MYCIGYGRTMTFHVRCAHAHTLAFMKSRNNRRKRRKKNTHKQLSQWSCVFLRLKPVYFIIIIFYWVTCFIFFRSLARSPFFFVWWHPRPLSSCYFSILGYDSFAILLCRWNSGACMWGAGRGHTSIIAIIYAYRLHINMYLI